MAEQRRRLHIVGASGHGKVAADCAAAQGLWHDITFYDDRWPELKTSGRWEVAGSSASLKPAASDDVFVAIGQASRRLELLRKYITGGFKIATIVHPSAIISASARLGAGTIAVAGTIVNIDVTTGIGCILNTGSSVDHDCFLGDGVHICPGTRLAGDVHVGDESWIGIGTAVKQGIHVGARVMVGVGAAVVDNIADDMIAVGVPAQARRKV